MHINFYHQIQFYNPEINTRIIFSLSTLTRQDREEANDIVNMSSVGERLKKRKANKVDVFEYTGKEPVPKDVGKVSS